MCPYHNLKIADFHLLSFCLELERKYRTDLHVSRSRLRSFSEGSRSPSEVISYFVANSEISSPIASLF